MMAHRKDDRLPASVQGTTTRRQKRLNRPPEGELFVWLTGTMLTSVAYRNLSGNAMKALNRIMVEHIDNKGTENGNLIATYDQMDKYGVRKASVAKAIRELTFFGFIRVRKGHAYRGEHQPNRYRLTWLPLMDGSPATNEWKAITEDHVQAWKVEQRSRKKALKVVKVIDTDAVGDNVVQLPNVGGVRHG